MSVFYHWYVNRDFTYNWLFLQVENKASREEAKLITLTTCIQICILALAANTLENVCNIIKFLNN